MTNNKLVFGIGTILILMTTVFFNVPSKVAIAQQQQDGEMNKIPMSKEMMQNMTDEEYQKKLILNFMDKVKKEYPIFADMVDKIPNMSLEEAVKNLFAVSDIEKLLMIHLEYLVKGKTIESNQTTTTTMMK